MNLTYEAIDKQGRRVSDTVEAPSTREGVEQLRRQGLFVTHVAAADKDVTPSSGRAGARSDLSQVRLPLTQVVLFTRQMSMLLTSGSALVPALGAIAAQLRRVEHVRMLHAIKEDLEEGLSLTDALSKYPRTFQASYCAVVAAGESSARLPQMFARLANIISRRRAMRNRLVGAMIYPLLLISLSINILCVMMFFVIPRFAGMFETLHVDLPTSTRVMMAIATTMRHYWFLFAGFGIGIVAAAIFLLRTAGGRQWLADVQIKIPVVGRLMSRLIQGQTFRILGMLLEARVGLLEALDLARGITRNRAYQALYDAMDASVTRGESISAAMETSGLVNPSMTQAVRTGEQSGRLGESITYVADVLDEENAELLAVVTKLIEPVILIGMGSVVGIVAVSLFMPLFDMTAAM